MTIAIIIDYIFCHEVKYSGRKWDQKIALVSARLTWVHALTWMHRSLFLPS